MKIAFDVDGTLIGYEEKPRHEIIDLLLWFKRQGHMVIVWSGGGKDYAEHWGHKLGLDADLYAGKFDAGVKDLGIDLAVDDEEVTLGKVNIKV